MKSMVMMLGMMAVAGTVAIAGCCRRSETPGVGETAKDAAGNTVQKTGEALEKAGSAMERTGADMQK